MAAYPARRRFGYSAREVAEALRYRSHGSVRNALARIETGKGPVPSTVQAIYTKLANDQVRVDPMCRPAAECGQED